MGFSHSYSYGLRENSEIIFTSDPGPAGKKRLRIRRDDLSVSRGS